jgi:hypothetical protein
MNRRVALSAISAGDFRAMDTRARRSEELPAGRWTAHAASMSPQACHKPGPPRGGALLEGVPPRGGARGGARVFSLEGVPEFSPAEGVPEFSRAREGVPEFSREGVPEFSREGVPEFSRGGAARGCQSFLPLVPRVALLKGVPEFSLLAPSPSRRCPQGGARGFLARPSEGVPEFSSSARGARRGGARVFWGSTSNFPLP